MMLPLLPLNYRHGKDIVLTNKYSIILRVTKLRYVLGMLNPIWIPSWQPRPMSISSKTEILSDTGKYDIGQQPKEASDDPSDSTAQAKDRNNEGSVGNSKTLLLAQEVI